jgi:hypothetical protein
MECMPSLILLKLLNIDNFHYLYVRKKFYKQYYELFDIFKIDKKFLICNNINTYKIKNMYILKLPLNGQKLSIDTNPLVFIFSKYLKNYFTYKNNFLKGNNNIFINRTANNNNTGKSRYISNLNEMLFIIKKYNIDIYEFEDLTFEEKFKILFKKKIIIMESGASIVNLYYSYLDNNTKIIFLTNETNYKLHNLFINDIEQINNIKIYKILWFKLTNNLPLIVDNINKPYTVDIKILDVELNNIIYTQL